MAQQAATGQATRPMPVSISAWASYLVFETAIKGAQLFIGVVSDGQWSAFCKAFGLEELANNPDYVRNNQRVEARDAIVPIVRDLFASMQRVGLVARLETIGLPFAPMQAHLADLCRRCPTAAVVNLG